VLVAHQYPPADVELVTIGEPTRPLVSNLPYVSARLSPDGRSIVFTQPHLEEPYSETPYALSLARGDGTGAGLLAAKSGYSTFAGPWFYYDDESGPSISLYRLLPPDGNPEMLATFDPPHAYPSGSFSASNSPDGKSVAYCHSPAPTVSDCFLLSPMTATPVPLPGPVPISRPGRGQPRLACDGAQSGRRGS
jgi:hypothetical protein